MSTRDNLRSKLLAGSVKLKTELIVFEGETYEVRQPTVGKRSRIFKTCGATTTVARGKGKNAEDATVVDLAKLQMQGVIECVYVPGTDEHVFGTADVCALEELAPGGLFDQLADCVLKLMNVDREEIAKNS